MAGGRESLLTVLVLAPIALLAGLVVIDGSRTVDESSTPIRRDSPNATSEDVDTAVEAETESEQEPPATTPITEFPETEFRAALADKPPFGNDETRAVCGKLTDCRLLRAKNVGSDAAGRTIRIVSSLTEYAGPPRRLAVEHWALLSAAGAIVDRQLLFRDAPSWSDWADEKKAAEKLPARLSIGGRTLSYPLSYVGFGWRSMAYHHTYEVSLDDLRLVGEHTVSAWHGSRSLAIDFDSAIARETWKMPACAQAWNKRPASEGSSVAIPLIAVDKTYARDWRTTELGPCAATVDGSSAGFVLEGAADAGDTSFKVIATSNTDVYVEVHDDAIVGTGAETDSIDVWLAVYSRAEPIEYCEPGNATQEVPAHLRIRVSDGAVATMRGEYPKGFSVEIASGTAPRLHLKLPAETDFHAFYGASLALAYRDTDDGAKVKRTIATSRIRTGTVGEIGRVFEATTDLRCAVRAGRLERDRPKRDPLRPLVTSLVW